MRVMFRAARAVASAYALHAIPACEGTQMNTTVFNRVLRLLIASKVAPPGFFLYVCPLPRQLSSRDRSALRESETIKTRRFFGSGLLVTSRRYIYIAYSSASKIDAVSPMRAPDVPRIAADFTSVAEGPLPCRSRVSHDRLPREYNIAPYRAGGPVGINRVLICSSVPCCEAFEQSSKRLSQSI